MSHFAGTQQEVERPLGARPLQGETEPAWVSGEGAWTARQTPTGSGRGLRAATPTPGPGAVQRAMSLPLPPAQA